MARRRAETAVIEEDDDAIDAGGEQGQASPEPASEGELEIARKVAKRLGWTPKEEWTRDPDKWRDADEFLDNTPREIDSLRERLRRAGQAAEDAIEEGRRRARAEAEAELRGAVREGDEDRAVAAADRVAKSAGPHPETVAWMSRNAWFETDPGARALAASEVERVAKSGGTIRDQLDAAEKLVRQRFPEHFGEVRTPERETRLSERKAPPAVTGGSRATTTAPKEKGWSDLPREARDQATKHFIRQYQGYGLTEAQAQARYAKAYWRDQE